MFFLLFGVRPRKKSVRSAEQRLLHCPSCARTRSFAEIRRVHYFELFFIPIFPIGSGERGFACGHCGYSTPDTGGRPSVTEDSLEIVPEKIFCVHCGSELPSTGSRGPRAVDCPHCGKSFEVVL